MPAKGSRTVRGPRFTKPKPKVRDARDPELYDDGVVAGIRQELTAHRLPLDGHELSPMPAELAQLEYKCDMPQLTGYAGMPLFMKFAYGVGLADLVAELPMRKRLSTYSPGKLCEVALGLLAAGLERVSHIDEVKHDPGLCAALGVEQLPDQATMSRFFADATARQVQWLRARNRSFSKRSMQLKDRPHRLVVDVDTREVGVYGKQEGAKHCPRRDGERMYTFEIATLRNTYDILDGGLLEGATHPAPRFRDRMRDILDQVQGAGDELIWCADSAWYAAHILQQIEAADADDTVPCRCHYAVGAQIRGELKQAIAAIPEHQWEACGENMEIAEVRYGFRRARDGQGGWIKHDRQRRYVVTRQRLVDRAEAAGQGTLLEQPPYELQAIVTDLEWSRRQVRAFYNRRVTVESILKESALGFRMDHLPSAGFAGNALFCQLLILAYNYVNVFRRLCLPAKNRRRYVQSLRRVVLAVPGWVERSVRGLRVHVSPHATVLPEALARLSRWLEPGAIGSHVQAAG